MQSSKNEQKRTATLAHFVKRWKVRSDMPNKKQEKECLARVKKSKSVSGGSAKRIHDILTHPDGVMLTETESPDIVVLQPDLVIGVEHCQVDVLFETHREAAKSLVSSQNRKCHKLIEQYKDEGLLEKDIRSGTAVDEATKMVSDRLQHESEFNYDSFILNFQRICERHNQRCNSYRSLLHEVGNGRADALFLLIEIPLITQEKYLVSDLSGSRLQLLHGIPITEDMISIIGEMKGFDTVILCVHPFSEPIKGKHNYCLFFDPKRINDGVEEQRIHLYKSFSFPYKCKVEFTKAVHDEASGTTDIKATVHVERKIRRR